MDLNKLKSRIQEARLHEVAINDPLKLHESGHLTYEQSLEIAVLHLKEKSDLYQKQLTEMHQMHGV